MPSYLQFPFAIGPDGLPATATRDDHIRQMLELALFTVPGERVNRPDFGGGVQAMVFSPVSDQAMLASQHVLQAYLQRWLGNEAAIDQVTVTPNDNTVAIFVAYRVLPDGLPATAEFVR